MPTAATTLADLHLVPLAGPPTEAVCIKSGAPTLVGRAADAGLCLVHETVSRRHCTLLPRPDGWYALDPGSTHGTHLNGVKLTASQPAPLRDGDLIRFGPWTFRVTIGAGTPVSRQATNTIDDSGDRSIRLERMTPEMGALAGRRLGLLIDCIAKLNTPTNERELAAIALEAALAGCGYERGAVLARAEDQQVTVLALRPETEGAAFRFSRSLLHASAEGQTVVLGERGTATVSIAASIAEMDIRSAICAPVMVDGVAAAFIYLDTRGVDTVGAQRRGAPANPTEAAAFVEAVARALAMVMSNLRRADLEGRRRELALQLAEAHEAQRLILPPESGEHGGLRYAMRMRPGVFVAGDLFDAVPLAGGGVAFFIGDVSGHGAGPGMLMAAAQSHLHASLHGLREPVAVVHAVNRYLAHHAPSGMFVSLWLGVVDADGLLRYVDAGHGHWLHRARGAAAKSVAGPKGIPLGIDPGAAYVECSLKLGAGDRVILYSDGAVEERDSKGEFFGAQRLLAALAGATSPEQDVAAAFGAVEGFSGAGVLGDDLTIASIEFSSRT